MDSAAIGTVAMIRIAIGAILMWIVIAMIGQSIEAGRPSGK